MTKKASLDKYYTPRETIDICVQELAQAVGGKEVVCIEPAAGDGRWLPILEARGFEEVYGFDIEPDSDTVAKLDFLKESLPITLEKDVVFVTNPPFGRACSLAVSFFNRAAEYSAEYIAFLIPRSFGKKLQIRDRLSDLYVLHSCIELEMPHFERVDGVVYNDGQNSRLLCDFQIWKKGHRSKLEIPTPVAYEILRPANKKVFDEGGVSREQPVGDIGADFTIVTHGTKSGSVEDFEPSTQKVSVRQFVKVKPGYSIKHIRKRFEDTDFSYFTSSSTIGAQGSINSDEIICCVEGIEYELKL